MKKRILILFILTLILSTSAAAETLIFFDPDTTETSVGEQATIAVAVDSVESLYGFHIEIYFDPYLLEAADMELCGFYQGSSIGSEIDNETGHIIANYTKLGGVPGDSGSGDFLCINFNAMGIGENALTFSENSQLLLIGGTPIPSQTENGFTIVAPGNGPEIIGFPEVVFHEDTISDTLLLDNYVYDPGFSPEYLSWSAENTANISVDIENNIAIFTPETDWFGTDSVRFTVENPNGYRDREFLFLDVLPVNDPPAISPIPPISFDEDESSEEINLNDYGSDVDGDIADISWSAETHDSVSATFITDSTVTISAAANWSGTGWITFTATDSLGDYSSQTTDVIVDAVNDPPQVLEFPLLTCPEDSALMNVLDLDDYVIDVDNDIDNISWSFSGAENTTVQISQNHFISLIPDADWFGTEEINFTAYDPYGANDSEICTLTVESVNDAPMVSDIPDFGFLSDDHLLIYLNDYVTDIDTPIEYITWTYAGNDSLMVELTHGNVAEITAPPGWEGSETLTFTASDGEFSDSDSTVITAVYQGYPPEISALPDIIFPEDSSATLDLDDYVSDPDDPDSALVWTSSTNSEITVEIDGETHIATFTAPDNWFGLGQSVTFTVTDPYDLSDTDNLMVAVSPVNDPPVISDIPDTSFAEDSTFVMNLGDFVYDVDNDSSQLSWTVEDNENIEVWIQQNIAFFSSEENWNGSETLMFQVFDPENASDQDQATLTVLPVDDPIYIDIPDTNFVEDGSLVLNLTDFLTDVDDGDDVQWMTDGGDSVIVNIDNESNQATFSSAEHWFGSEVISFIATDGGGHSDSDTTLITVTPVNDAPEITPSLPTIHMHTGETDTVLDLDDYVIDVDNADGELEWEVSGNNHSEIEILEDHQLVITCDSDWIGTENLHFTVYDPENLTDDDNTYLVIEPSVGTTPALNSTLPEQVALHQNYPNPFNPTTAITVALPQKTDISLKIYDISGKLVKTLINDERDAGYHTAIWNGTDENGDNVGSGIFIYKLSTPWGDEFGKMIMMK